MNITWLIIGIVITGLSTLAITIFSLSRFILKRIYKEEEKAKTDEQKSKDKTVKRALKSAKFILKRIYKYLLKNYLAFYGITAITFSVGAAVVTVSSVNLVREQKAMDDSSEVSSETPSSEESSSETSGGTSSEISSVISSENSSSEESSEDSSSESSSLSSDDTTSIIQYYTVAFYASTNDETPYYVNEVEEGGKIKKPTTNPERDHGVFKYWTTGGTHPTEYDLKTPVTSNLNLYPKFNPASEVRYTAYGDVVELEGREEVYLIENGTCAEDLLWYFMEDDTPVYLTWVTFEKDDPNESWTLFNFSEPITQDTHLWGIRI